MLERKNITRVQLAEILRPEATDTHKPIATFALVNAQLETHAFRHISVVADEYALTADCMRFFGVPELESTCEMVAVSHPLSAT